MYPYVINSLVKKYLALFTFAIIIVMLLSACASTPDADFTKNNAAKNAFQARLVIGAACNESLATAKQWIESNALLVAENVLRNALNDSCNNGYEQAQLQRLLAYVMSAQKKYVEAIKAYQYVIHSNSLNIVTRSETVYTLAQIHFLTNNYKAVIDVIELALANKLLLDDKSDLLLARSYHRVNRPADALATMQHLVVESEKRGVEIKESWLRLLWLLYFEDKNYQQAMLISQKLIAAYPSGKSRQKISLICDAAKQLELCIYRD